MRAIISQHNLSGPGRCLCVPGVCHVAMCSDKYDSFMHVNARLKSLEHSIFLFACDFFLRSKIIDKEVETYTIQKAAKTKVCWQELHLAVMFPSYPDLYLVICTLPMPVETHLLSSPLQTIIKS